MLAKSDQGTAGDSITQPGLVDNNCNAGTPVATLSEFATIKPTTNTCSPTPCGAAPKNADAAIAAVVPGTVSPMGNILELGAATSTSIAAAPPSSTLATASFVLSTSEQVAKSGRTTGLTCSTLQAINASISVDYDTSCAGTRAFTSVYTNQLVVNGGSFSGGGDSGSLIVTADTARPLGLLYGGSTTDTVANPIQDVIAAFTNGSGTPSMVGGSDHAVSCQPTSQTSGVAAGTESGSTLSSTELKRMTAIKEKYFSQLMLDPAVSKIEVGMSKDHPGEGAIVLHASSLVQPVPV